MELNINGSGSGNVMENHSEYCVCVPQLCSFRCSVNVNALLFVLYCVAPEVLKSKGYNRSLDMWSVGVIIYVRYIV